MIAALNVDNGDIIWRRVLEREDRGKIQLLQSLNDDFTAPNSLRVSGRQDPDRFVVTVTGTSLVLIRIWNIRTGNLGWEWSFQSTTTSTDQPHYFATSTTLYHIQPDWNSSSVELTAYSIRIGQIEESTRKVAIGTNQQQNCGLVQSFVVCQIGGEIIAHDLVAETKKVIAKSSSKPIVVKVSWILNIKCWFT